MTDWFTVRPCVNGCLTTDGNVAVATLGAFCTRCHDLASLGLTNAAPLVGHLISQIGGLRSKPGSDGSMKTKGASAPLPFNARAFDDANTIYRLLVGWAQLVAVPLHQPVPTAAVGAWRQGDGQVVGLPMGVSVLAARAEVERLAKWHRDRLGDILSLDDADMVARYLLDIARLQRINLKWPTEDRPAFSRKAACPDCAARLLIVPPREYGADRGIVCSSCGRHFTEAEHDRIASYVAALARAKRKAVATAEAVVNVIKHSPPTEPIPVVLG